MQEPEPEIKHEKKPKKQFQVSIQIETCCTYKNCEISEFSQSFSEKLI